VFDLNIQVESTAGGTGSQWFVIPEYPKHCNCQDFTFALWLLSIRKMSLQFVSYKRPG
jgi:hypothetical protein